MAPILPVGPFFCCLFYDDYFFLFCIIFFFFFLKVSRARFYKGTKPKSLRSFPVRPTVWSFGASLSASLPCFFFFLLVNQCMPFKSIIAIFLQWKTTVMKILVDVFPSIISPPADNKKSINRNPVLYLPSLMLTTHKLTCC